MAPADFRLTRGEPAGHRSSERFTRHFCPRCGSPLFGRSDDPEARVSVTLCALDDPERVAPKVHQWRGSGLSWFETRDDLPRVEEGTISHPDRRGG